MTENAVIPKASAKPDVEANGPFLVMREDAVLPDRCVNCNAPARGQTMRKRLFWSDAATEPAGGRWSWVPYVNRGYAFISMFDWFRDLRTIRFPAVRVGVCQRHWRRAVVLTVFGYVGMPAGLTVFVLGITQQATLWTGVLLFLAAGVAITRPRPVKAVHVGRGWVTLAGVGAGFLADVTAAAAPRAEHASAEAAATSASTLRDRMSANRASRRE